MTSFDKRGFAKLVVNTVVSTLVGAAITKTLSSTFPKTQKFKLAEMSGTFGAWIIGGKLEPYLDEKVDDFFDTRIAAEVRVEHTD
jgi:hypothetical protein